MPPRQAYTEDGRGRLIPVLAGQALPRVSYGSGPAPLPAPAAHQGSGNRPRLSGTLPSITANRTEGTAADRPFAPFVDPNLRRSESDSEDDGIVVAGHPAAVVTSTTAAKPNNAGRNLSGSSHSTTEKATAVDNRIAELQRAKIVESQRSQGVVAGNLNTMDDQPQGHDHDGSEDATDGFEQERQTLLTATASPKRKRTLKVPRHVPYVRLNETTQSERDVLIENIRRRWPGAGSLWPKNLAPKSSKGHTTLADRDVSNTLLEAMSDLAVITVNDCSRAHKQMTKAVTKRTKGSGLECKLIIEDVETAIKACRRHNLGRRGSGAPGEDTRSSSPVTPTLLAEMHQAALSGSSVASVSSPSLLNSSAGQKRRFESVEINATATWVADGDQSWNDVPAWLQNAFNDMREASRRRRVTITQE